VDEKNISPCAVRQTMAKDYDVATLHCRSANHIPRKDGKMEVKLLSITPDAENLIETAGRTACLSTGQPKKLSTRKFIRRLINNSHLSVLEHAYATFRIAGGSRALTHQLVRHRLCSYTQQSQRFVDESTFNYVEPERIKNNKEAHLLFVEFMDKAKETYAELEKLGIRNEDARFVLPNAVESIIVVTANFRQWRHIIELRGNPCAQWEIRRMAIEVLKVLKTHAPAAFEDLAIDEQEQVVTRAKS
jgi:thymidylate synthase (FAD)